MKLFTIIGLFLSLIVILVVSLSLYTFLYYDSFIVSKERLLNYKDEGIVLLDRNDVPFYHINNANSSKYTPLDKVSLYVAQAIIATEDRSFYEHYGISPRGMIRSMLLNLQAGSFAYGGSTITQQLVKNTLLSPQKSIIRKAQEAVLALRVETIYTKEEILEMYVNSVYFGEGAIGINEAAQTYFAKEAKDLTLPEAAYLAGMLRFPNLVSPYSGDRELGVELQKQVIEKMEEYGMIGSDESRKASNTQLAFKRAQDSQSGNEAPHYALLVIDYLKERYGNDVVYEGLKVKTSLDLELQKYAQSALLKSVNSNIPNGVSNGAVVAMHPLTGEVLALVGSANWFDEKSGKINMAMTPRQPGSSFKPIVYSLAMDLGIITPATVLRDEPKTFILDASCRTKKNCTYKPENYDKKYRGPVTVRRSLANSLNIPSVEIMQRLGIDALLQKAPDFGITTFEDPAYYGKGLSLVLGSAEISPFEMTQAYSAFANNGNRPEPQFILEIKDKFGKVMFRSDVSYRKVIGEQTAYLINSILSDNNARSEQFGSMLTTPYPSAVKTGTTENYRDAWTIGYTPSLVVTVWVGNNDSTPIKNLPGSLAAAPIWKSIMGKYASNRQAVAFKKPDGIVLARYCDTTSSGSARIEYFTEGTQPRRTCTPRQPVKVDIANSDANLPRMGGGENAVPTIIVAPPADPGN